MADVITNDAAQSDVDVVINEPRLTGEWPSITINLGAGPQGRRGEKGDRGEQGDRGDTGETGETGNGIASAVLNADYTLTLTYTDGTTWTSGSIRGERGDKGDTGADGYSPAATVTQTETGATISITDAEGTTTANIRNGQDGAPGAPGAPGSPGNDGVSPTISVTDITGGHRITITDATGAHSFDVMDGEGGVGDVTVEGYSVVHDGVARVRVGNGLRTGNNDERAIMIADPNQGNIRTRSSSHVITPSLQHMSTFYGLAWAAGDTTQAGSTALGQYTESAKSAISEMLNGSVPVSGTTPTINALPGIRYICGEVTTIDIVTPASGIIDVVFTSGSTPAVLTVTPPSGMTMKWANGFDPTTLEADTTYEINIADGCLGVAGTWS